MPQATEIEATYRVVTPCFCGGADQRPEFRLPSFKGVLRFWWRALAWSHYEGALADIRRAEDELFGSAGGGQSRVRLRLEAPTNVGVETAGEALEGRRHAHYLAYGMLPTASDSTQRKCLLPCEVTVAARLQPRANDPAMPPAELPAAFAAIGLLGGIGAKSRKGFGSLALQRLMVDGEPWHPSPMTFEQLQRQITETLRGASNADLADYTALSRHSRCLLVRGRGNALAMLDALGKELKEHHKEAAGSLDRASRNLKRAAFGLPRHHGAPSSGKQLLPQQHTRRASPLMIHMHECDDAPVAVLTLLPARFLPEGASEIGISGSEPQPVASDAGFYDSVGEFLDRCSSAFSGSVEVRP